MTKQSASTTLTMLEKVRKIEDDIPYHDPQLLEQLHEQLARGLTDPEIACMDCGDNIPWEQIAYAVGWCSNCHARSRARISVGNKRQEFWA